VTRVPIAVTGVKRRFGAVVAVDGVTFQVDRGEMFGLIGPTARERRPRCG
jgi:ABC-type branched-subunit amino acid transport system ATPase component